MGSERPTRRHTRHVGMAVKMHANFAALRPRRGDDVQRGVLSAVPWGAKARISCVRNRACADGYRGIPQIKRVCPGGFSVGMRINLGQGDQVGTLGGKIF